tara:strand:- start:116 stop:1204 length:1089 start_codon:yes stop_codon:yes gene_type:complete
MKNLEPAEIKKFSEKNPEQILYNSLYNKFGERYVEYRKRYERNIKSLDTDEKTSYPNTVVLELVNRCNLACPFCKQWFRNDAIKSTLDDETLDKIFDDFEKNNLNSLMLTASEPLLYKNIDKVLDRAEKAKIMDVFLFTNGALLNEKNAKIILNSCITRLFISIDAFSKETYDKVRIPVSKRLYKTDRLKELEENILRFMKLRKELKTDLPLVRTSFLAYKENKSEINDFVKKWKQIVDSVEIQTEMVPSFEMKSKDRNKNIQNWYKELVDGPINSANNNGKVYSCREPWSQISVYADGTIVPCCTPFGRNIPIGNIKNQTIKEAWNGKEINKIRSDFKKNTPNEVCKACIDHTTTVTNDIF